MGLIVAISVTVMIAPLMILMGISWAGTTAGSTGSFWYRWSDVVIGAGILIAGVVVSILCARAMRRR
jgi:hypothetical protein